MFYELFIGGRYLRSRQSHAFISLITLLSVAGVTVGVMALIVVIAVMAGFEADLKSRILGVQSHIVVMHHEGKLKDVRNVLGQIKSVNGVAAATPFVYTQVMLRSSSGVSGAVLRGVDPESARRVISNLDSLSLEPPPQPTAGNSGERNRSSAPRVILGKELARKIGARRGDEVYMISSAGMLSPIGHLPVMKRFQVVDYFESGMYEFDVQFAFISLPDAQKMLRMGKAVTGIEVRVEDVYQARAIARRIVDGLGYPYWARDWTQMNRNLFSALKLEKKVMFIILALIILVAAFNIASTLIMMVMQKTRDIAILKAMGASNKSIMRIFVFKGMVIGLLGTVLGVCLGFLLCVLLENYQFIELPGDIYYITTLPVKHKGIDVFLIAVSALVICFFATLYPARQASLLDPVEAIRYG